MERDAKALAILTVSVIVLYISATLIDVFVSLTVFKYAPKIFLKYEENRLIISYVKGDYSGFIRILAIYILFLVTPIPPLIGYMHFKRRLLRIAMLMLHALALVITASIAVGHIIGALSWLV